MSEFEVMTDPFRRSFCGKGREVEVRSETLPLSRIRRLLDSQLPRDAWRDARRFWRGLQAAERKLSGNSHADLSDEQGTVSHLA